MSTHARFGSPSYGKRRQRYKRESKLEKKKVKPSLFADDMILYTENPKDTIRKLLKLIDEFGKVTRHKITHRNLLHSYRLTMEDQKETKDLHIEIYKTLMKEIKDDTNRWRNIPYTMDWKNQCS